MWYNITRELRELWYAPMIWPIIITFEITMVMHWSTLVLVLPLLLVFIVGGMCVLLPVQLVVFAALFVIAPFVVVFRLVKRITSP